MAVYGSNQCFFPIKWKQSVDAEKFLNAQLDNVTPGVISYSGSLLSKVTNSSILVDTFKVAVKNPSVVYEDSVTLVNETKDLVTKIELTATNTVTGVSTTTPYIVLEFLYDQVAMPSVTTPSIKAVAESGILSDRHILLGKAIYKVDGTTMGAVEITMMQKSNIYVDNKTLSDFIFSTVSGSGSLVVAGGLLDSKVILGVSFTITPAASGQHRYDLIYVTDADTLGKFTGTETAKSGVDGETVKPGKYTLAAYQFPIAWVYVTDRVLEIGDVEDIRPFLTRKPTQKIIGQDDIFIQNQANLQAYCGDNIAANDSGATVGLFNDGLPANTTTERTATGIKTVSLVGRNMFLANNYIAGVNTPYELYNRIVIAAGSQIDMAEGVTVKLMNDYAGFYTKDDTKLFVDKTSGNIISVLSKNAYYSDNTQTNSGLPVDFSGKTSVACYASGELTAGQGIYKVNSINKTLSDNENSFVEHWIHTSAGVAIDTGSIRSCSSYVSGVLRGYIAYLQSGKPNVVGYVYDATLDIWSQEFNPIELTATATYTSVGVKAGGGEVIVMGYDGTQLELFHSVIQATPSFSTVDQVENSTGCSVFDFWVDSSDAVYIAASSGSATYSIYASSPSTTFVATALTPSGAVISAYVSIAVDGVRRYITTTSAAGTRWLMYSTNGTVWTYTNITNFNEVGGPTALAVATDPANRANNIVYYACLYGVTSGNSKVYPTVHVGVVQPTSILNEVEVIPQSSTKVPSAFSHESLKILVNNRSTHNSGIETVSVVRYSPVGATRYNAISSSAGSNIIAKKDTSGNLFCFGYDTTPTASFKLTKALVATPNVYTVTSIGNAANVTSVTAAINSLGNPTLAYCYTGTLYAFVGSSGGSSWSSAFSVSTTENLGGITSYFDKDDNFVVVGWGVTSNNIYQYTLSNYTWSNSGTVVYAETLAPTSISCCYDGIGTAYIAYGSTSASYLRLMTLSKGNASVVTIQNTVAAISSAVVVNNRNEVYVGWANTTYGVTVTSNVSGSWESRKIYDGANVTNVTLDTDAGGFVYGSFVVSAINCHVFSNRFKSDWRHYDPGYGLLTSFASCILVAFNGAVNVYCGKGPNVLEVLNVQPFLDVATTYNVEPGSRFWSLEKIPSFSSYATPVSGSKNSMLIAQNKWVQTSGFQFSKVVEVPYCFDIVTSEALPAKNTIAEVSCDYVNNIYLKAHIDGVSSWSYNQVNMSNSIESKADLDFNNVYNGVEVDGYRRGIILSKGEAVVDTNLVDINTARAAILYEKSSSAVDSGLTTTIPVVINYSKDKVVLIRFNSSGTKLQGAVGTVTKTGISFGTFSEINAASVFTRVTAIKVSNGKILVVGGVATSTTSSYAVVTVDDVNNFVHFPAAMSTLDGTPTSTFTKIELVELTPNNVVCSSAYTASGTYYLKLHHLNLAGAEVVLNNLTGLSNASYVYTGHHLSRLENNRLIMSYSLNSIYYTQVLDVNNFGYTSSSVYTLPTTPAVASIFAQKVGESKYLLFAGEAYTVISVDSWLGITYDHPWRKWESLISTLVGVDALRNGNYVVSFKRTDNEIYSSVVRWKGSVLQVVGSEGIYPVANGGNILHSTSSDGKKVYYSYTDGVTSNQNVICFNFDFDGIVVGTPTSTTCKVTPKGGMYYANSNFVPGTDYYFTAPSTINTTIGSIYVGRALDSKSLRLGDFLQETNYKNFGNKITVTSVSASNVVANNFVGINSSAITDCVVNNTVGRMFFNCGGNNVEGIFNYGDDFRSANSISIKNDFQITTEKFLVCKNNTPISVYLPDARDCAGKEVTIKKLGKALNSNVFVRTIKGQYLDDVFFKSLITFGEAFKVVSNGEAWLVLLQKNEKWVTGVIGTSSSITESSDTAASVTNWAGFSGPWQSTITHNFSFASGKEFYVDANFWTYNGTYWELSDPSNVEIVDANSIKVWSSTTANMKFSLKTIF